MQPYVGMKFKPKKPILYEGQPLTGLHHVVERVGDDKIIDNYKLTFSSDEIEPELLSQRDANMLLTNVLDILMPAAGDSFANDFIRDTKAWELHQKVQAAVRTILFGRPAPVFVGFDFGKDPDDTVRTTVMDGKVVDLSEVNKPILVGRSYRKHGGSGCARHPGAFCGCGAMNRD